MSPEAASSQAGVMHEALQPPEETYGEVYYMENFGVTYEEAQQEVKAGEWSGTLGQMLTDPKCPVGPQVREAYKQGGMEAAHQKLDACKMLFPEFTPRFGND